MKSVADTFSPFAAYRQLRQEQAELRAQHRYTVRERAPLPPAAPNAWQRDHFIAATKHDAQEALHRAQLGAVYVKQPVAYVLSVVAEAALFGALVVVGLAFAAVGELMAYLARRGCAHGASHHVNLAIDVCIFGVYAPIQAVEHMLLGAIDAVVIVGAMTVGTTCGALCYAAGSRRYLQPAEQMQQPLKQAGLTPSALASAAKPNFMPLDSHGVNATNLGMAHVV